ncbi:VCBS domain-containing protein, partial [Oleiphilus sp. HI0067]
QLQHGDVDANDTHTWKVLAGGLGAFGVMTVDALGKWTYVLDQNKAQALSDGQTATETFQIEVQDQHGERSVQTVNVHVDGANDVPQITGTDTGRAIEGSSIAAAGSWTAVDPDALDQHTWSVATPAQYGTLTIDANGNWSYVLHQPNHADIDQLADGELKTDTAIIQVDDGHGSIVTQQVTLTITGTNDAPNISGVLSGTVQDGGTLQASGQLLDGDVDASDMHTWNILGSQQG